MRFYLLFPSVMGSGMVYPHEVQADMIRRISESLGVLRNSPSPDAAHEAFERIHNIISIQPAEEPEPNAPLFKKIGDFVDMWRQPSSNSEGVLETLRRMTYEARFNKEIETEYIWVNGVGPYPNRLKMQRSIGLTRMKLTVN
jgi:hypothetical protein